MDRRKILGQLGGAICASTLPARASAPATSVTVHIHPERMGARIPPDFVGLGYEISSVAIPGLLSTKNTQYVQLVRNLGPRGVIRIGGNTSDFSTFHPNGDPLAVPKGTVINRENLKELGGFLDAIGWQLIWGVNLGEGTVEEAVEEAKAVSDSVGGKLLAFEVGNEPDLFAQAGHRSGPWGYNDWLADYRRYKAAIRQAIPAARFAGPDVAGASGWAGEFARDEGHDAVLLTHHYYIGNSNQPSSTFEKMMTADPRVATLGDIMTAAGKALGLPYRICETNSFSGGGKGGVSDTLGSALWVLDFLFLLASKGCAGVNMETGVNHLGFISSYSPIRGSHAGDFGAAPEYYGLLAFAMGGQGTIVPVDVDAKSLNLTAYATRNGDRELLLTVINKDESKHASLAVSCGQALRSATVARLSGPSARATNGARFCGAMVDRAGHWQPMPAQKIKPRDGEVAIPLPASSAVVASIGIS